MGPGGNVSAFSARKGSEQAPSPTLSSPPKCLRRSSPPSVPESLASLSQASQELSSSLPSSPKSMSNRSYRHSDEESMDENSQAIVSSEDEVELSQEIRDSAPQLIMPSIKMPSRRPFTDRGKQIGRLKVMIVGDSGQRPPTTKKKSLS